MLSIFRVLIGKLYVFFEEMTVQILFPIVLNVDVFFFLTVDL